MSARAAIARHPGWSLAAWSAALIWRAPEWGLLHGLPLDPLSTLLLAVAWWIVAVGGRVPWPSLAVGVLVLKVASGAVLLPRGFDAAYYANDAWAGAPEPGLYAPAGQSGVARDLAFGGRHDDLPLHFLNDRRTGPRGVPVSAEWRGVVNIETGVLPLYLAGALTRAEMLIDDVSVLTLEAPATEAQSAAVVRPGWARLVVRASWPAVPSGRPPSFDAGWRDPRSRTQGSFGPDVFRTRPSTAQRRRDAVVRTVGVVIDGVLIVVLAGALLTTLRTVIGPERPWTRRVVALLALVVVLEALARHHSAWGHTEILAWGSDRRWYVYLSRDVVLHGVLMARGATLGAGEPYYFQLLYPYFLAAVQSLTGEGLWGAYVLQRVGLGAIVWALWQTAVTLFGARPALVGVPIFVWFVYLRLEHFSRALYNESLFLPLLALAVLWLTRECARPGTRSIAAGGFMVGLATMARSTLAGAAAFAGPLLWLSYRRAGRPRVRLVRLALLLAVLVAIPATRNWFVSGRIVLLTTGGAPELINGNRPPESIDLPPHAHRWRDRLLLRADARAVAEVIQHRPWLFVRGLLAKTAYVLGLESVARLPRPPAFATTEAVHWTLVPVWVLAVVGLWMSRPDLATSPGLARLMPLAVALSQMAVLVLSSPYSERLVLPLYMALTVYLAVPATRLIDRVRGGGPPPAAHPPPQ